MRETTKRAYEIGKRMIAEQQRTHLVAITALRLMQEHYGNPYFSFHCASETEQAEWYRKAAAIVPPVGATSEEDA